MKKSGLFLIRKLPVWEHPDWWNFVPGLWAKTWPGRARTKWSFI